MLQAFKNFIRTEKLILPGKKTLLAVSGGIDSIAMAELFYRSKFPFAVAHANFQLRGEESDEDEHFVSLLAKKYKVPFFCKRFFTADYADLHGVSTQMAARELRYTWFNELLEKEGFYCIATAHHLDDQIETFFINMLRSTGIAGFHGILPRQGHVIRPMLFTTREQILGFAMKNGLQFREDASNLEVKYLRNKIRHELLPVLSEINPGFKAILTENINRIREAENIFRDTVNHARKKNVRRDKDRFLIPVKELKHLIPLKTYLFEFLSPFGFNFTVTEDVCKALDEEPGKLFFSPTHRLIKDREDLIITPLSDVSKKPDRGILFAISEKTSRIKSPVTLTLKKLQKDKAFKIDLSPQVASFDLHKITFPLILRRWKHGDIFYPFGRNHRKKLSDYFTDNKFSICDKENIWLLCCGEKIIWIIGHRIDNRFRITSKTREVLTVTWHK